MPWDDSSAMQAMNNGSDIFYVTVDVMEYYGIPYDSLSNIKMVMNNGVVNPAAPWAAAGRDDRDGEDFGAPTACSDLVFEKSEVMQCDLADQPEDISSNALLAGGSCVDRNFGLVKVSFNQKLNCPEADSAGVLDSAMALGYHSGVNGWTNTVEFDSPNAKRAVNDGSNNFYVVIDPLKYYGVELDSLQTINLVMNNGAENREILGRFLVAMNVMAMEVSVLVLALT